MAIKGREISIHFRSEALDTAGHNNMYNEKYFPTSIRLENVNGV